MGLCDITNGRRKQCKVDLAGVRKVYFFNDLEDSFTVVDGVATAMNPLLIDVYEYDLVGDGHSLAESVVGDRNSGTAVNTQTLTILLNKLTKEDNKQMNLLTKGYPRAVVKSKKGDYHVVGFEYGLDFTVATSTGAASADFNGYTLTGVSMERELAPIMSTATRDAFLLVVNPIT